MHVSPERRERYFSRRKAEMLDSIDTAEAVGNDFSAKKLKDEIGKMEKNLNRTVKQAERDRMRVDGKLQALRGDGNKEWIDFEDLGVDMLSLSGHKIHAPKGIGLLYVKQGVRIENLIDGGGQERGKRGGTENMPYIVGLATAVENAYANLPKMQAVAALRDSLRDRILATIPHSTLNGPRDGAYRLPGNLNIGFAYIEGESMLLLLDAAGICASTGSACSSASLDPSHVLLATGVPHERAHGSISSETSAADADYILEVLPPIIKRLRDMSPLYEEALKAHKV